MKKYKLIKEYPGSPKLGCKIIKNSNRYEYGSYNFSENTVENYPEFWEQVVEKDYEILSFKCLDNSIISSASEELLFLKKHEVVLHSVKRFSDSEIFTIGDKVEFNILCVGKAIANITGFQIYGETLYFLNKDLQYNASLDIIGKKIKPKLFTTEDGVDIFEGDSDIYYVDLDFKLSIDKSDAKTCFSSITGNWKFFSTKEKAEDYIIINKPCLSYKETLEIVRKYTFSEDVKIKLKELVQQKLK